MPLTTYTAGQVLTAASLNANFTFAADNPATPPVAVFNETQASGTSAGTFTAGSYIKRTLNTTVVNNIPSCTLTSSVIALPAGTYVVIASGPAHSVSTHMTRLQNTTDSTTIAFGEAAYTTSAVTRATVTARFVLTATKNIELQHRCEATQATNGLGVAVAFSNNIIFSTIEIAKIV